MAAGFHPSSIFDEVATNTTAPVNTVDDQDAVVTANPAANITAGLETLAEEVARYVATFATNLTTTAPVDAATMVSPAVSTTAGLNDLVREAVSRVVASINTTTPTPITTGSPASWATTNITTLKRAVERAAMKPEVAVDHVSIIIIFIMNCQYNFFV